MKRRVIYHLLILSFFTLMGICTIFTSSKAAQPIADGQEESTLTSVTYTIDNQFSGTKDKFLCYKNKDGIIYLPLKDLLEPSGFTFKPCPQCGHDEVYPNVNDDNNGLGHFFANWYQDTLSYSISDKVEQLSAANEVIDGRTYCPTDLFEKIGMKVTVYEDSEKILLSDTQIRVLYFYSPTCKECQEIHKFLDDLQSKYKNLTIARYDTFDTKSHDLLQKYGDEYNLKDGKKGFTPSIFISDKVLIGAEIKLHLEEAIIDYNKKPVTKLLASDAKSTSGEVLSGNIFSQLGRAIGFGLLNGISPCNLSIFLFLLSLLLTSKDKMLRCGFGFIIGKVVAFFLIGTILYKLMRTANNSSFGNYLNIFMIIFALIFAILNLIDFFNAKNENYGKIKLQLPSGLKKINHNLVKWGNKFATAKAGTFIMFFIGMVVASGEFVCGGEFSFYLSNVTIIVQEGTDGLYPLLLLLIYSIAFVIPLIILLVILYIGKSKFNTNEFILDKLPWIKLISALLFIGMAIYFIFA